MANEILPTVRVCDDGPRGYRIINASEFDASVHRPWPPAPAVELSADAAPAATPATRRPRKVADAIATAEAAIVALEEAATEGV